MKQSRSWQHGFTIVEMLFILVVIGILLALIFVTHAGVAQSQRNMERQRDIGELRDELEAYYSQNNVYPALADINNAAWRAANMKALDKEVLRDPSSKAFTLAAKPAKQTYAYTVTSASGTACDDKKVTCTQYTLTAMLEGGGTYVKNNLN